MSTSINVSQIVNDTGKLSIEVFRDAQNSSSTTPTSTSDGKLELHANGKGLNTLLLHAPHGEVSTQAKKSVIQCRKKCTVISPVITLGKDASDSQLEINSQQHRIHLRMGDTPDAQVDIQSETIHAGTGDNQHGLHIDRSGVELVSKQKIHLGHEFNRTLTVDCHNDHVHVKGNMSVSGDLYVSGRMKQTVNVETVLARNTVCFDLRESNHKTWALYSKTKSVSNDGVSVKTGLFYKPEQETLVLQNGQTLGCFRTGSLEIESSPSSEIPQNILSVNGKKFCIDSHGHVTIDGHLKVTGTIEVNDTVQIKQDGSIWSNGMGVTDLLKFTVGKHCRFQTIQSCINYIEKYATLDPGEKICIEILPNKVYREHIVVRHPGISFIGKHGQAKIHGSVDWDLQNASPNINGLQPLDCKILIKNIDFSIPFLNHFILNGKPSMRLLLQDVGMSTESQVTVTLSNWKECEWRKARIHNCISTIVHSQIEWLRIEDCIWYPAITTNNVTKMEALRSHFFFTPEDESSNLVKRWILNTEKSVRMYQCTIIHTCTWKDFQTRHVNLQINKNMILFHLFFQGRQVVEQFCDKIILKYNSNR